MELYLFSGVQNDPVLSSLLRFARDGHLASYYQAARGLLEFAARRSHCGHALREYLICALLDTPGVGDLFADPAAARPYLDWDAGRIFEHFFAVDWDALCREREVLPFPRGKDDAGEGGYYPLLRSMVNAESVAALEEGISTFFARYHDRYEARYTAFRWKDGRLRGIRRTDGISFDQLAGLRHQKEALVENARAFLAGLPAHNVLLVGGSGTGKSSCVRATLTAFHDQGLRLVELPKQQVGQLPAVMEALVGKKCHYIVYIDDLSFEEVDEGYKELKVALDGQVEERLSHVLIYVTSNRRHLVRETWKDRGEGEEIHENDTLHEKLSLSERFGLHLTFSILSQKEYFAVVELLLSQHGIAFTDELGREAAAWALTYNGRSGRTAKQFVQDVVRRAALG